MSLQFKKARQLDFILRTASENRSLMTEDLTEIMHLELSYIGHLCEYLAELKMVDLLEISTMKSATATIYIVSANNKGKSFVVMEGGFRKQYWIEFLSAMWKITKIIAGFINSAAVIWLAYLSYDYQKQKDIREQEEKRREKLGNSVVSGLSRVDSLLVKSYNLLQKEIIQNNVTDSVKARQKK